MTHPADQFLGRVPPSDLDAERSVIGGCLLHPEKIDEVQELLQGGDFYSEANELLWKAMAYLREKKQAVDPITMSDLLRRYGHLEQVGGLPGLYGLIDGIATAANMMDHAQIVRDLARVRAGIHVCLEGLKDGYDDERGSAEEYLSKLAVLAEGAAADRERSNLRAIKDTIGETARKLEAQRNAGADASGVPTGLPSLDKLLGGLHPGEITICAGRPGSGKSALAMTIALHAAQGGLPVLFCSLEMSRDALQRRLLSMVSGVDGARFLSPKLLTDDDLRKIADASHEIAGLPIHIDDSSGVTVPQLRGRSRRAVARLGIKLIVIDYLQRIHEHRERGERKEDTRERAVASMINGIKDMAGELSVPVLLLAQLNRQCEQRQDKRPVESDLRESGAAEQDGDVIIMLYRPSKYDLAGSDEILIRKHRNGPTGTIEAWYQGPQTRWVEGVKPGDPQSDGPPVPFYAQHYQEQAEERGTDEPF